MHERRLLAALYERQRKQHPVITCVTDIILDIVLASREDYEVYIKVGYPFSKTILRRRLKTSMAALSVRSGEAPARIKTECSVQGFSERSDEKPAGEETRFRDLSITTGHAIKPVDSHPGASAEVYPRRQATFSLLKRNNFSVLTQTTPTMRRYL